MLEFICLLLPVAAFSGWYIGKRAQGAVPPITTRKTLSCADYPDYHIGLNFLLNEQPDKAVDAFIRMLDVSPDSIESTLSLGNFFRRRGEVDRAIRIHQSLVTKPNLTATQRSQSLLELAQDYMRAGVYDRAESLLLDIIGSEDDKFDASLRHLVDIYEREKEWEKAINIALRLQTTTHQGMGRKIAHYYCELAELAQTAGKPKLVLEYLREGLKHDTYCARVSFIEGNFEKKAGEYRSALKAYKRIECQDPAFLPEAILMIIECYDKLGETEALAHYLDYLMHRSPSISLVLAYATQVQAKQGKAEAACFLTAYMHKHPSIRGLRYLIDFHLGRVGGEARNELLVLQSHVDQLLEKKPVYRCSECGFASKLLHWQCPSCREWACVKPIQGIEGE